MAKLVECKKKKEKVFYLFLLIIWIIFIFLGLVSSLHKPVLKFEFSAAQCDLVLVWVETHSSVVTGIRDFGIWVSMQLSLELNNGRLGMLMWDCYLCFLSTPDGIRVLICSKFSEFAATSDSLWNQKELGPFSLSLSFSFVCVCGGIAFDIFKWTGPVYSKLFWI